MKKLLTILILVIVFTENVYAEIRKYKCNFSSNDYDLSFMNDENEFNLTNGELITANGQKLPKGPFAKEGVEIDTYNNKIGLDISPNDNVTGHLFIDLKDGSSEAFFYKIDEKINNALMTHIKNIIPSNIKNNKQPFFKVIYSANEFLKDRYPDSLFLRIESQC
ncbi:hypothetical protein OAS53_01960 [Candidatus Pelagibacter ubique]|jgi:hypothetical protein|nr:hypothetical protein [Candidatus Pelagibacter ubique]